MKGFKRHVIEMSKKNEIFSFHLKQMINYSFFMMEDRASIRLFRNLEDVNIVSDIRLSEFFSQKCDNINIIPCCLAYKINYCRSKIKRRVMIADFSSILGLIHDNVTVNIYFLKQ